MSCKKDDVDVSMAFNKGHSDAWEGRAPELPCKCLTCNVNQKYREGHVSGTTARYYYDMGVKAGRGE